jgi:hypothetical protein
MSRPAILAVDGDPVVAAVIGRGLRNRYGADYRVEGAMSIHLVHRYVATI